MKIKIACIVFLSMCVGFLASQIINVCNTPKAKIPVANNIKKESRNIPTDVINCNIDDFNSKKFKISYSGKGIERHKRYGVTSQEITFNKEFLAWKGGKKIPTKKLREITRLVFKTLPHIKTTEDNISLIVETIVAESDGGRIISNEYGDYGVMQIKVRTSKDILAWLKQNHHDIYISILKLRNEKLSEKDNLIQNIPYAIAIGISEYWRKAGGSYYKYISSVQDRAIMWKSTYNTFKGEGTVNKYIKRVEQYKI